ncbi:MAG: efflux RND transporter periplasmic adaptor subunit [Planctomycetota bacterium]
MRIASLVMLVAASFVSAQPSEGPPPARVTVDAARLETVTNQRRVTGEIVSTRRAVLASQVEGLVLELDLDEGDRVESGQVVARLDDELARLDVRRAQAALKSAEAVAARRRSGAELAQRDMDRMDVAVQRGSANEAQADATRTALATAIAEREEADADVLAAQAELARIERILKDKTIAAPFTGRVVRKQAEIGEWVSPGDGIVELVSLEKIEARIDVPEALVPFLDAAPDAVSLSIPGLGPARDASGTVIGVIPAADSLSRLFPVRISVPNSSGVLRPQMSLTAMVPTSERAERLTIHKDAILRDDAGSFVFMAAPLGGPGSETPPGAPSHQAVPMRVQPLFAVGERYVIRDGALPPGALVLTDGNERVFPTQPLIILPGGPVGAGAASTEGAD